MGCASTICGTMPSPELAESQASDQTIMSIAGHVSPKMLAHYSHVRLDAKRKAPDTLSGGGSAGSYGTNSETNPPTLVDEKGFEPSASSLRISRVNLTASDPSSHK
jgi:hypothetical protein